MEREPWRMGRLLILARHVDSAAANGGTCGAESRRNGGVSVDERDCETTGPIRSRKDGPHPLDRLEFRFEFREHEVPRPDAMKFQGRMP